MMSQFLLSGCLFPLHTSDLLRGEREKTNVDIVPGLDLSCSLIYLGDLSFAECL
jgi:hypothetical protein